MPHRHDPNSFTVDAVEKTIGLDNELAVLAAGKLGDVVAELGELGESAARVANPLHEAASGERVVGSDVADDLQVGRVNGRSEADDHLSAGWLRCHCSGDNFVGIAKHLVGITPPTGGDVAIPLLKHG